MISKKPVFLLFAFAGALPWLLLAQDRPRPVEEQLRQFRINRSLLFNYDLYQFAGESADSTRLDLVVSLVNDLLQFVKESDSLYRAGFELTLTVMDESDDVVSDGTFRKAFTASSFEETNLMTRVHAFYTSVTLPPGDYELLLELTDLDIRKSLRRSHKFSLASFKKPLTISNALISTAAAQRQHSLDRLGDRVSPAISAISADKSLVSPFLIAGKIHYQLSRPLTLYTEFSGQFDSDTLMLAYRLLSNKNEAVWKTTEKVPSPAGPYAYEITLDPADYKPGLYHLEIFARNRLAQELHEIPIYFNRILAQVEDDTLQIDEVGPLQYITSQAEFEDLTSDMQNDSMISAFWLARDPSPETKENELQKEFAHRVRFANRNFVSLIEGRQGWQTDQGRAYILYGPPSEIFHPSVEDNVFQHEIWVYDNQQLKMRFVFVFKPQKGEYGLLSRG